MKKYNRSKIFKRAWAIVKSEGKTISEGLRQAWAEAKTPKSEKERCIERLELIVRNSVAHSYCELEISCSDWNNYGKSRTYFSIIEHSKDRRQSKHYAKADYGYIDNKTNVYVPGRHDLNKNYAFGGSEF